MSKELSFYLLISKKFVTSAWPVFESHMQSQETEKGNLRPDSIHVETRLVGRVIYERHARLENIMRLK